MRGMFCLSYDFARTGSVTRNHCIVPSRLLFFPFRVWLFESLDGTMNIAYPTDVGAIRRCTYSRYTAKFLHFSHILVHDGYLVMIDSSCAQ